MTIDYRKYNSETDQPGLLELIAYLQDYELEIYNRMKPSKDYIDQKYIDDLLESCQENEGEILVATASSSSDHTDKPKEEVGVVGYACVLTKVPAEEEHEIDYVYGEITDLAVHPNHQRKGIAKTLLTMCEQRVKDAGTKYMRTEVLANNKGAVNTYLKHGFQPHLMTLEKEL